MLSPLRYFCIHYLDASYFCTKSLHSVSVAFSATVVAFSQQSCKENLATDLKISALASAKPVGETHLQNTLAKHNGLTLVQHNAIFYVVAKTSSQDCFLNVFTTASQIFWRIGMTDAQNILIDNRATV